jgi:hypothetical protein
MTFLVCTLITAISSVNLVMLTMWTYRIAVPTQLLVILDASFFVLEIV